MRRLTKTAILFAGAALAITFAAEASASDTPLAPSSKLLRHKDHSADRHKNNDRHGWNRRERADYGWRPERGRDFRFEAERGDRRHYSGKRRDITGDGPLPDTIDGLGTFAGAVSAERVPQVGTYYYYNGNDSGLKIIGAPDIGSPNVIAVTPESFEAACDRQNGVCIVRPH